MSDTRSGLQVDLSERGANPMDVGSGSHRAASFDGQRQHLLYLRKTSGGDILVARTLATGQELELGPDPGFPWRARLDSEGKWVLLQRVANDTG